MQVKIIQCLPLSRILILGILLSLFCFACNQPAEKSYNQEAPSVEGVWKMTYNFIMNEFGDTVWEAPEQDAHKLYLDGYVMWNSEPDPDSGEWYGFGTYELRGDTIIERLSTMSYSMQEMMDFGEDAVLVVEFDEHNFMQHGEWTWRDTVYRGYELYIRLK